MIRTVAHMVGDREVVEVVEDALCLQNDREFLDLTASLRADDFLFRKEHFDAAFYDLRSGFAGEVMQKISNYGLRMGVVGDFSSIDSRSLRDFIRECNAGRRVVFLDSREAVLEALRL